MTKRWMMRLKKRPLARQRRLPERQKRYAFVLHMRLIPGFRGRLSFNFASAFAYLSIMMTYFGVNFYLSGLHSYASGDQAVTPKEAYMYIGFLLVLFIIAFLKHKKYFKK